MLVLCLPSGVPIHLRSSDDRLAVWSGGQRPCGLDAHHGICMTNNNNFMRVYAGEYRGNSVALQRRCCWEGAMKVPG